MTITTVGYGDYYPVTLGGRITTIFIMITGVAIIGALASILASVLVGSSSAPAEKETPEPATAPTVEVEFANVKNEWVLCASYWKKCQEKVTKCNPAVIYLAQLPYPREGAVIDP